MEKIYSNKKIELRRSTSDNTDFRHLVGLLDEELKFYDGDMHDFYHQYNGIEHLDHIVLAYQDELLAGCGAFKPFDEETVEIKRMYVDRRFRRIGLAAMIVRKLETWAGELCYSKCILETGVTQKAAIGLYSKLGYYQIDNFGPYIDVDSSICFQKDLGSLVTP